MTGAMGNSGSARDFEAFVEAADPACCAWHGC